MSQYCYCKGPPSGTMICCDYCDTWYHCECVGITEEQAALMDTYICDNCQFINEDLLGFDDDGDNSDEEDFTPESARSSHSPRRYNRHSDYDKDNDEYEYEGLSSKEFQAKKIQNQIFKLEQELLFEDNSPSIHDEEQRGVVSPQRDDDDHRMEIGLTPYPVFSSMRKILKDNQLLDKAININILTEAMTNKKKIVDTSTATELEPYMRETSHLFSIEKPPQYSIPINADIRTFNFKHLCEVQHQYTNQYFDCLMMDPPWQLSCANPTRGVAIAYQQLDDSLIQEIPVNILVPNGLLFIWVINAKYRQAFDMMNKWGFEYIDEISWVKCTKSRRLAKSHGYYLQHSKETCLIAKRGSVPAAKLNLLSDIIWAERTGQSQKPMELYKIIEQVIPNGYFMEIFGRRNNLRNNWVTVGNEL